MLLMFVSQKMTSIWKKVLDLTYPYTSMFTGRVVCTLSVPTHTQLYTVGTGLQGAHGLSGLCAITAVWGRGEGGLGMGD